MIPGLLEVLAVGLVAGSLGALLGVGGGVVLVPGFALVAGLPMRNAVAASLVCVAATSVAGSVVHLRRRHVSIPLAMELQFFTAFGAAGAGLVAVFVPAAPLHFAFALLLLYSAAQMWASRDRVPREIPPHYLRRRRGLAAGASLSGGVMAGLLGVGGGVVFVPVLHLLLGRPFHRATATSVYMIGITASAAALVYLLRGDVQPDVAAVGMVGTLAGAATAAAFGHRADHRALKIGFALLLVYIAVQMVRRGVAEF